MKDSDCIKKGENIQVEERNKNPGKIDGTQIQIRQIRHEDANTDHRGIIVSSEEQITSLVNF